VKNILLPFAGETANNDQVFLLLGSACLKLGQYREALGHYQKYLSRAGSDLAALNAVGECHFRLGEKQEALRAWEKSLEIDPRQETIKRLVEEIRSKKDQTAS